MLAKRPNFNELFQLRGYLESCQSAATPPPILEISKADMGSNLGLLGLFTPPKPKSPGPTAMTLLGAPLYPEKLADMLTSIGPEIPDDGKRLGERREDRVAQLEAWLQNFVAFSWLQMQPAIQSALKSFDAIRKRRKTEKAFADDIAIFRFWQLAACAATFMDSDFRSPPNADERAQAIAAAKRLRNIASTTTLLNEAGINYPESTKFLQGLAALEAITSIERRERVDSYTNDRKFIRLLSEEAARLFGDIPPALIYQLSALKVKNPDKTAVTKQISEYKKEKAATV
ncbi:hypothetical protein [Aquabacterium sp. CECT 9606]|uniref:hypothetical protein n=1 Tax=Aquabacterium sp. CECT 9606 TaxID=2845822 RepID=UPI001E3C3785|nr:hypothetical protein [Aquabacterium sp. CECT 9606]